MDGPEQILERCTTSPASYRISGSDVSLFCKSPFSLFCKNFVDYSERDPPDFAQALLTDYGHSHEDKLMRERYPGRNRPKGGARPRPAGRRRRGRGDPARGDGARIRGFERTLQTMREGAESLLEPQLCFLSGGMHGSPDVLERRPGESDFGDYYYIIKEIKSARKIKRKHVMQAAFYNMMLGEIQGHFPDEFYLLNAAGEEVPFKYDEYRSDITDIINEIVRIKGGRMPPALYGRGIFPWSEYCDRVAAKNDDLSLITGMDDDTRQRLLDGGISTVSALALADAAKLKKSGINSAALSRHVARASALAAGEAVGLGGAAPVPAGASPAFLKLDEGLNGEPYMLGILAGAGEGAQYTSFVSAGPGREAEMLSEFLRHAEEMRHYLIYHWGSGGRAPLARLAQDGSVRVPPMEDLQETAAHTVVFPTYRDKLKLVAEQVGFRWTDPEAEWGKGVLMYNRYLQEGCRDCLEYIKEYNRDNCAAVAAIWNWMAKHRYLKPV